VKNAGGFLLADTGACTAGYRHRNMAYPESMGREKRQYVTISLLAYAFLFDPTVICLV
jgi:hypothetical protein